MIGQESNIWFQNLICCMEQGLLVVRRLILNLLYVTKARYPHEQTEAILCKAGKNHANNMANDMASAPSDPPTKSECDGAGRMTRAWPALHS